MTIEKHASHSDNFNDIFNFVNKSIINHRCLTKQLIEFY